MPNFHHWTRSVGILAACLTLAACGVSDVARTGAVAPTAVTRPAPGDLLLTRQTNEDVQQLVMLDSASGAPVAKLPLGAPDQTWRTVYTAACGELKGHTTVRALDPRSGTVLRETQVAGDYQLASVGLDGMPGGLSPNGRWLVLVDFPAPGAGQEQGKFAVLNTAFSGEPKFIELKGRFSFDAISDDGRSLYLTEHLTQDLSKYQVRLYDLALNKLDENIIVDKTNRGVMRGVRHTSLPSKNGEWLFSLYLNDAQGPFIHALNMTNRYAMCVPLLPNGKQDHAKQLRWSLALSPDGTKLYAVNGALGLVSILPADGPGNVQHAKLTGADIAGVAPQANHTHTDSNTPTVIEPGLEVPTGFAAIAPDGKTLYTLGNSGVLAIDTAKLQLRAELMSDMPFESISLSADGQRLYAGSTKRGTITQVDFAAGTTANTTTPLPTLKSVLWVAN